MTRICHICNTLQIPKYLKKGNFVKFLSVKIRRQDQNHSSNQLYMPEPDVQKKAISQSAHWIDHGYDHGYEGARLEER